MKFIQLNTHRAQLAAIELHRKLNLSQEIALITEPYTYRNKLVDIPAGYKAFLTAGVEEGRTRPRAAILLPFGVEAVKLDKFCNRDCEVILCTTTDGKLLLGSIYLDILKDPDPDWLVRLLNYANDGDVRLILGADTNAHSQLFGPTTNSRGEILEDLIFSHGLYVENRGTIPTFDVWRQGTNVQSCIDVTMTRGEVNVRNWGVYPEEYNASDHNTIRWDIPDLPPPLPLIRPWKKAKWDVFTRTVAKAGIPIPDRFTEKKLDRMVGQLYDAIDHALELACPKERASKVKKEVGLV